MLNTSSTLWFLKVSLNSHIFQIYSKEKNLDEISNLIINNFRNGISVIKSNIEPDKSISEITYTLSNIDKLNVTYGYSIFGSIIKSHKLFAGKINPITGDKKFHPVENDEKIMFYYDVYKETVIYHKTNRFGQTEFLNIFKEILNKIIVPTDENYYFEVAYRQTGMNFDEIRQELRNIKKIEELKIKVIPPNPETGLEDLHADLEYNLDNLNEGHITEYSIIFKSKTPEKLNIDSTIINNTINQSINIHSKIPTEEILNKGYVEIVAIDESGNRISSLEMKPIKHSIPEEKKNKTGFINYCRDIIDVIIRK